MCTFNLPNGLERILDAIRRAGGHPLIVGGAVRDAAIGVPSKDFDIEVYELDLDPLTEALMTVGKVNQVGKSFGVLKVSTSDLEVDISLPRRESKVGRGHKGFVVVPDASMTPKAAASRRDFTINALAFDPGTGELLDFFDGLQDLKNGVLRHTSAAFADDPLRVLRGMQLAGRFRLRAASATVELSRELFDEYDTLAIERVWAEWYKWAAKAAQPSLGLLYLEQCGWRKAYAELEALQECPQDPEWHPEGDVWTHTLLVTDAAASIAGRDGLVDDDRAVLVLAALTHDLGKPETTVVDGCRVRSPGHTDRLQTYERFLARIGCPRGIAERVVVLARHHMTHLDFAGSPRHVRRAARSLGEGGETIEMLARIVEADHSGRPPLPGGMPEKMANMLEEARALAASESAPEPLLMGRHLLELGVLAGPRMGQILRAAYEAQLDGAFQVLEEAKAWVRKEFRL